MLFVTRGLTVASPVGAMPPVLQDVNFSIAAGQVLGLFGESGAGKSMLARAIARQLPPGLQVTHGTFEYEEAELLSMPGAEHHRMLGREITFLPQPARAALNSSLTVRSHLDEHHRRLGVRGRSSLQEYAVAALKAVRVPDPAAILEQTPIRLTYETRLRIVIALAFASRPKLLVADEPLEGLDPAAAGRIIALLQELRLAQGAALLFATRDMHLASSISDESAILYRGEIVEIGPAAQVLRSPKHPYTRCVQLAAPKLSAPRQALYLVPQAPPGTRREERMRAGCRFAPRCPVSAEYCLRTEPPLEGDAHRAACIRPAMISGIAADQDLVAPPLRPIAKLPILELEQISVPGGLPEGAGARDLGALAEVSLQIAPGEFVGVVGEHASGKSILAQLVAGSAHPAAGRMMLAGRDITRLDTDTVGFRIGKVQMIFPGPTMALNPHHRIADIVTQFLHQQGARFAVRERRARELLAEVGIPLASAGRRPGQLSLGERLLVGVARAICSGPQLVIADDVLDGLDIPDRARFLMLLHRLRQTHPFALLFVSNDLPAIRHLCDRVLVMHQGTIVEDGLAETVFGWPMHPQTKALLAGVPG